MKKTLLSILLLSLLISNVYASAPNRTYNYVSQTTIDPTQVNTNENSLYTYVQNGVDTYSAGSISNAAISNTAAISYSKLNLTGSILNADISGSAAITDSKLATISTAGKVSGAALTSLSSTPSGAGVLPIANLATGTPTGTKFVRDDGTLQVPANFISVGSSTPSAVSSSTISGLTTGVTYKVVFNLTQNTSIGTIGIQFNTDTGANYSYVNLGFNTAGINSRNTAQTSIVTSSVGTTNGTIIIGEATFTSAESNTVRVYGQSSANDASGLQTNIFSGKYVGAAGVSSVTILTSAGTITGTITVYKLT